VGDAPVALVTGANKGIGRAVAEQFLRDGYAVGLATRSPDEPVVGELGKLGEVHHVWGDLQDPTVPAAHVDGVAKHFARLDVLVNNAGLTTAKPALELSAEDFDNTFQVDVRAALLASQAAALAMGDRGGVIVNITSVHEHVPRPGFLVYAAAKAALGMLTRGLALELAPNVRVVAVAPGAIATERNVEAEELRPEIPLGRPGKPEEVAAVVAWLCSPDAAYITGTSILVDGALAQQVVNKPAGR
jgi:NAD(P)-dependent dehydrogenase (short-subunit alcohol dehydrogenase family)